MTEYRCPDCGVIVVGNHLAVCRFTPEPVRLELENYRDVPKPQSGQGVEQQREGT